MKRIYNLLTLVMLMCFTSSAMATVYPGTVKTTFSAGDEVFLKSIYASNKYLAGLSNSATASEENVYVLEDAGDSQFYLKQQSTNKYIAFGAEGDPGEFAAALEDNVSSAVKFAIEAAVEGTNVDTGTYGDDISIVSVFRITNMPSGENTQYLSGYAGVSLMPYTDSNPMIVYSVDSGARAELNALFQTYNATSFSTEGGLTHCSQELVDAYTTAYDAAQTAYTNGETNDEIQPELDALKAAIAAANAGDMGYVRFISANSSYTTANTITDNGTRLTAATLDEALPEQVWKLTKMESGNYKVQNIVSKMYMNYCDGTSAQVRVASAPEYEIVIAEGAVATEGDEQQYRIKDTKINMQYHRDGGGAIVGWNNDAAGSGSAWFIRPLEDSEAEDLLDLANYQAMDNRLDSLVAVANSLTSRVGRLVSGVGQIYSNADQNTLGSQDGSGYAGLIDGNINTYWHSCYAAAAPAENHYLQFTLDEAVQNFMFKYTRRFPNNNNRPTDIIISASNDGENFEDITEINEGLPVLAADSSYTSETIDMGAPYKYIRFTIMATQNDQKNEDGTITKVDGPTVNGFPFVTFSEFNVFDPDKVAANTGNVEALQAAVGVADAVEALSTTQEDIDALQAAIDEFRANVVDPTDLKAAIATAQTLSKGASVGTDPGEYNQTDKDALDAAIAAAEAAANDKNATVASLAAALEAINAAIDTFNALEPNNDVLADHWYYIKGSSKAVAYLQGKVMHYDEASNTTLFGDLTDENKTDAAYQWRLVQLDDTHYAIQNKASGKFFGVSKGAGGVAEMVPTNAGRYTIKELGTGAFNLVEDDQIPMHGQSNGTVVVYWEGGLGSASCWTFDSVESPEAGDVTSTVDTYTAGEFVPLCFPVGISSVAGATLYTVSGKEVDGAGVATAVNLKEVTSVPAGQPFILKATGAVTYTWDNTGSNTPGAVNGLVGTYGPGELTLTDGLGYFDNSTGKVEVSDGTNTIAPYGAYFNEAQMPVSTDGDDWIEVNGVLTSIGEIAATESDIVNVYTVTGVLVRKNVSAATATQSLPKGIYIVGKKKVAVK